MFNLIHKFFNTLIGVALPESVVTILAFALVSTLFTAIFSIFGVKYERVWRFATYVSIGVLALLALSGVNVLSLTFGGA